VIGPLLAWIVSSLDAAEADPAKKATLKQQIDAEIAARKAAEAEAAKRPKPLYPVGLQVQFGKRKATITEAHQDAQGAWHYTIALLAGEFLGLGDGSYQVSEADMRAKVAGEVGQQLAPGQAFPQGVAVYRNGQGGMVSKVAQDAAGAWQYTIAGWPNTVTQEQLLAILRK
jgi:hypothetical protein